MANESHEQEAMTRYRTAEANLWGHYGVTPTERFVGIDSLGTRVRVQEVGEGPPLLFIHGGPNAGSTFAPIVAAFPKRHCIVLDRPGCGLAAPVDYDAASIPDLAVAVIEETLDARDVGLVDLVGSSFGGSWAMWFAATKPDRVGRVVLQGAPAFVPGMLVPGFVKLMLTPVVGSLIGRLPPSVGSAKRIYRMLGHSESVVDSTIPAVYWEWVFRLAADTDTMANDGGGMAMTMTRRGSRPGIEFSAEQLGAIKAPTLLYWGDSDTFGGADVARATAELIPDSSLRIVAGGGHLPWLDAPDRAATAMGEFLA